uniref:Ycf36 n=1 Tax=Hommersandiophycus borowitzkae TaxID=268573 RepID=A0A1G4NU83_9FLOR|nr:Hypothetical protein ycf36 [Hommersandiophycus borowitzkae]SCW22185.1 Hypothetical protein ycf36 [Hommersandiophycus borowitzkae]
MSSSNKICPVPFDQQPLNEYKTLKQSFLFQSSTMELPKFILRLLIIFVAFVLLGLATSFISMNTNKISLSTISYNILFSLLSLEVLLIRLYLGWSYILKRLSSASVFYEESGWYDGQLWIKNVDMLTQDRLVGLYQVQPIIVRIQRLLIGTSLLSVSLILCLLFIS